MDGGGEDLRSPCNFRRRPYPVQRSCFSPTSVSLIRRLKLTVPSALPFWISLVFALNPIHSEPLAIVLFRMDMLGAMFSLIALWSLQRLLDEEIDGGHRAWLIGLLFVSIGMAQLSKEVFAAVLPLHSHRFHLRHRHSAPPRDGNAGSFPRFSRWNSSGRSVLVSMLRQDSRSEYPYHEVIGLGVQSPSIQSLSRRARSIEGSVKVLHGTWALHSSRADETGKWRRSGVAGGARDPGLRAGYHRSCSGGPVAGGGRGGTVAGSGDFRLSTDSKSQHRLGTLLVLSDDGTLSLEGLRSGLFSIERCESPMIWMWITVLVYGVADCSDSRARLKVMHSRIGAFSCRGRNTSRVRFGIELRRHDITRKTGGREPPARSAIPRTSKEARSRRSECPFGGIQLSSHQHDRIEAETSLRRIESLFPGRAGNSGELRVPSRASERTVSGDCRAAATAYARAERMDPARNGFDGLRARARIRLQRCAELERLLGNLLGGRGPLARHFLHGRSKLVFENGSLRISSRIICSCRFWSFCPSSSASKSGMEDVFASPRAI